MKLHQMLVWTHQRSGHCLKLSVCLILTNFPLPQVNGAITYLPFRLVSDGMWAYYHGDNIVIRTDFGLFVSFDQLYHLVVRVPESYQGQTCGLCGNYNGRSNDDLFLPTGHPASSVQVFAAAWRVDVPTAVCADDCAASVCGACRESRKASYVHSSQCGILQAPYGPFSACFSTINPADFYNNCVHDLCKARGNTVILCRAIHAYVTACQAAGVKIKPWRTAAFCRKSSYRTSFLRPQAPNPTFTTPASILLDLCTLVSINNLNYTSKNRYYQLVCS